MSMVFKDSFTKEDYDELYQCLQNERILLSQVLLKIRKTTKKALRYSRIHIIHFLYGFNV